MRMCAPAGLQSLHGSKVDQKHDEVEDSDVVAVRIEPEWKHPLIHHHTLHH